MTTVWPVVTCAYLRKLLVKLRLALLVLRNMLKVFIVVTRRHFKVRRAVWRDLVSKGGSLANAVAATDTAVL